MEQGTEIYKDGVCQMHERKLLSHDHISLTKFQAASTDIQQ